MGIEYLNVDHKKKIYWTNQRNNYAPNNACSKYHKFGHLRKNCRTQVHSTNQAKDKVDIVKVRKEMNQKWKKRVEDGNSGAN